MKNGVFDYPSMWNPWPSYWPHKKDPKKDRGETGSESEDTEEKPIVDDEDESSALNLTLSLLCIAITTLVLTHQKKTISTALAT
ncbi:MAG: hypothetical protein AAB439_01955 [Patescibacteria group bacterium]